jgi:hypothetical protein
MARVQLKRKWYVNGRERTDNGTKLMNLAVLKSMAFNQ